MLFGKDLIKSKLNLVQIDIVKTVIRAKDESRAGQPTEINDNTNRRAIS